MLVLGTLAISFPPAELDYLRSDNPNQRSTLPIHANLP